jgi:hypothetical protein
MEMNMPVFGIYLLIGIILVATTIGAIIEHRK